MKRAKFSLTIFFFIKADKLLTSKHFDEAFYGDDDDDDGEVSDDNADDDVMTRELKPVGLTSVADRLRRLRNKPLILFL